MGVASVLNVDPVQTARDTLEQDKKRRDDALRAVRLYSEDSQDIIEEEIGRLFTNATVRHRMLPFARIASSQALYSRIVDETSRPVYAVPPVRYIYPERYQERFSALAHSSRLNEKMDLACRLVNATNHCFLYTRYVERLARVVIEVITPDMMSVVSDPDDPTLAIAYIYDKPVYRNGKCETWHVYWDDTIAFQLDANKQLVPFGPGEPPVRIHGLPSMPFVAIHIRERWGHYWNTTRGNALRAATIGCSILTMLSMRLLKAQGFNQVVITGDVHTFPKDQVTDEESAWLAPEGSGVTTLNNKSDASHYLALLDSIKNDAAANRGLSRARLNQEGASSSSDTGLMEERADLSKVMRCAEIDQFEVLKMVTRAYPEESTIAVDFGEMQHRVDRKTQLEIRDMERKLGLRNVLDDIREDNPEIQTTQEAEAELQRNIEVTSTWVDRMRALNMAKDVQSGDPGRTAEQNGAMGPMVRDGKAKDLREMAMRVLRESDGA